MSPSVGSAWRATLLGALLLGLSPWPDAGIHARPGESPEAADSLALSRDLRVRVAGGGRDLILQARPRPGESAGAAARRIARSASSAHAVESPTRRSGVRADSWVEIPLTLASDELRVVALLNLFPRDRREGGDWIHLARDAALPLVDEGLWQVAEWFCGDGQRFVDLARVNRLASPELKEGQEVRIPSELLLPALASGTRSDDGALEYGRDGMGEYAGYRLRSGEALWTAVVGRFTGRTAPDDVEAVAAKLAARSGIADVTDIPVAWKVKIPVDLLEPEYLPKDHPRRRESDRARLEVERAAAAEPPPGPERDAPRPALLILDPGHGGGDRGTIQNGVLEHEAVYDVACRVKAALESRGFPEVLLTVVSERHGCSPGSVESLAADISGSIPTDPPHAAGGGDERSTSVHLRWYLANSRFRSAVRDGTDPRRVVFISLHADSRHPSLRGAMVYVPGVRFRSETEDHATASALRIREVREEPKVRLSRRERARAEALSRRLAARIVEGFRAEGLAVQPYKPVRDRIIRGRRTWLPAVLRGSVVPASVLVEIANLGNPEDAAVLSTAAGRSQAAAALAAAVTAYLGGIPQGAGSPRAAARP